MYVFLISLGKGDSKGETPAGRVQSLKVTLGLNSNKVSAPGKTGMDSYHFYYMKERIFHLHIDFTVLSMNIYFCYDLITK